MKRLASLVAVLVLALLVPPACAIPGAPTPTITLGPDVVTVDVSAGPATAVFNGTVAVTGLPLVRYKLNISAEAGGWDCVCDPGAYTFTQLVSLCYTVTVTVPADALGGDFRFVNVTANLSTADIRISTNTTSAELDVNQSYGVRMNSGITSLRVDSGKTVSWPLSVLNTGNGRDTLHVLVVDSAAYTSNNWTLKFNRSFAYSVDPVSSALFTLNITPPAGAPNQTVTFQVTGQSWGASNNDLTVQDQIFLNLTVNYVPVPGGGGGNKTATHNPIPASGPLGLAVAGTLAMLAAVRKRKWTDCRR